MPKKKDLGGVKLALCRQTFFFLLMQLQRMGCLIFRIQLGLIEVPYSSLLTCLSHQKNGIGLKFFRHVFPQSEFSNNRKIKHHRNTKIWRAWERLLTSSTNAWKLVRGIQKMLKVRRRTVVGQARERTSHLVRRRTEDGKSWRLPPHSSCSSFDEKGLFSAFTHQVILKLWKWNPAPAMRGWWVK